MVERKQRSATNVALTAGQHSRSCLKGAGAHEVSAFLTTHGSAVVFPPTL